MKDYRHCKQHKIENASDTNTIDHISNLPNCILHHILSFMPTKEVVKTSILSTRWKSLWASVSNIDFDDASLYTNDVPNMTSFVNFVDKILRSRDRSNIEKFRLSCRVCFNASTIRSWISNVVIHNVRELDLCLFTDDPNPNPNPSVILPKSMFDTTSLVTLKLEMNCVIEFPVHVSFPCLKTLNLSLVTFTNDKSLQKLFSGCPVLENLFLLDCEWMNLTNVVISSSSLKKLTIDDLPYFGPLDENESNGCKIKIEAVNLVYLEYIGYLSNEIFLNDVSSLVKACVHIPVPHERQKEVAFRAVDLLKGLQYVASLRVSTRTMESIISADSILGRFPVYPNLTRLVLTMIIGNNTFTALMDLLKFCPILQSLCLSEGFDSCIRLNEKDSIWLSIPICMSSCLKTMTFNNFHANDSEICFLKCVLKYAHVLLKMDIGWCKTQGQDLKKRKDVKKELEMSSTLCVVNFS